MKTLEEIKHSVALEYTGGDHDWYDGYLNKPIKVILMDEVAKRYATEAIKADRERVAKAATIALRVNINGQGHPVVNKESILNLPIELP